MALIFGPRGLGKVSHTIRGATVDDAAGQLFSISSYSQVTIGTSDLAKSLLPIVDLKNICGVAVDDAEGGGWRWLQCNCTVTIF